MQYLPAGTATDNSRKVEKIRAAVGGLLRPGMRVLDVGAGEAWALEYFREMECSYAAIEPVEKLSQSILERGGSVLGASLFELDETHTGSFDVILFRHVVEHLRNPLGAFERIRSLLSPAGVLMVALPNAAKPSIRKGFRTSFLRPVHISYFTEGNVIRLAQEARFDVRKSQTNGEIILLLEAADHRAPRAEMNYYSTQRTLYRQLNRRSLLRDLFNFAPSLGFALRDRVAKGLFPKWRSLPR